MQPQYLQLNELKALCHAQYTACKTDQVQEAIRIENSRIDVGSVMMKRPRFLHTAEDECVLDRLKTLQRRWALEDLLPVGCEVELVEGLRARVLEHSINAFECRVVLLAPKVELTIVTLERVVVPFRFALELASKVVSRKTELN